MVETTAVKLTSTFMKIFSTLTVFVENCLVRTSVEAIAARNALRYGLQSRSRVPRWLHSLVNSSQSAAFCCRRAGSVSRCGVWHSVLLNPTRRSISAWSSAPQPYDCSASQASNGATALLSRRPRLLLRRRPLLPELRRASYSGCVDVWMCVGGLALEKWSTCISAAKAVGCRL